MWFSCIVFAAGKLAPIFTKGKGNEPQETKPAPPPEDPELVRKRKEFLMSGVPTELKRQAANLAPTVVFSDFVPFPDISHVQQKSSAQEDRFDVWSLSHLQQKFDFTKSADSTGLEGEEFLSTKPQWTSLQWQPTAAVERKNFMLSVCCLFVVLSLCFVL
jgi:hypothetical protein